MSKRTVETIAREAKEEGRKLAAELITSLNVMGFEKDTAEGFVEELMRSHRTLQQSFGRLLLEIIKGFAEQYKEGRYDPRNEGICKLCHHLAAEAEGRDYLPFI